MTAATDLATTPDQASPPQSPWMSVHEAATYARRHYKTVLAALQRYGRGVRTTGALKGHQEGPNCVWSVHRSDLDRWVCCQPPSRATRVA
jgi:hypothetical protein